MSAVRNPSDSATQPRTVRPPATDDGEVVDPDPGRVRAPNASASSMLRIYERATVLEDDDRVTPG
jgi:hypothetical protein